MREYPNGRLNADDDGALQFAIGADLEKGVVVIDFGKPTNWIAMPPKDAVALASLLVKHARSIAKEPLEFVL